MGTAKGQCSGYHIGSRGLQLRIVSLLASATEIVCALGAGEMLVGRSHECDHPEWVRGLPACSSPAFDVSVSSGAIDAEVRRRIAAGEELYRVDGDLIRKLRPDLVIAQSHCEVCAVTPRDMERSGACLPMLALSASSVEGIFESVGQVAARLGLKDRAVAVVARERARLDEVRARTAGLRRPRVVMLEWIDPLFAMGNWGPELVEIANGELMIGKSGEYSGSMGAEALIAADPEILIIAPCGFDQSRAERELDVLARHSWWSRLRAVRAGKVAFADGNLFFNRSGMTIARTAEIIAEILHGVEAAPPSRGVHWRWIGGSSMKKVLLSWSSGKDCAWSLHLLRQQADIEVVALITTFNQAADRVAMHAVRRVLVEAQAERVGLPLWAVDLPWPCSNEDYEVRMKAVCDRAVAEGITAVAFGDLFLEDVRDYRIQQMAGTGLELLFPAWGIPTNALSRAMITAGVKARITCVDPRKLDVSFAGRDFDLSFVEDLPEGVDPCGENGEFHSFVYDAPVFSQPIAVIGGEVLERDGFVFADVVPVK